MQYRILAKRTSSWQGMVNSWRVDHNSCSSHKNALLASLRDASAMQQRKGWYSLLQYTMACPQKPLNAGLPMTNRSKHTVFSEEYVARSQENLPRLGYRRLYNSCMTIERRIPQLSRSIGHIIYFFTIVKV